MHFRVLVIAIVLLGSGCGSEPGVPRAEHEALLQRLDAMDQRVDALEEAIAKRPTPGALWEAPEPSAAHVLAIPPPTGDEPSPTLSVRVLATGVEVEGKAVSDEDLLAHFRIIASAAPDTRLSLMAETDAPYAALVRTMDLAREAGLTNIAIKARVHGEGEAALTTGP